MAKYRGAYREDVGSEEKPYSQELAEQANQQQEPVEMSGSEEASFKKRYGDLRRHTQQQIADKDREIQQMKQQLEAATKQQIRFPKTEKEIAEWVKKYPEVAKVMDTIAQKRSLEALAMGERKMEGLKRLEQQLSREKAETTLRKMHPDFDKIRSDPKFHKWAAQQPGYIRDALYKNTSDPFAAARAIDLYKADIGRKTSTQEAASSVGRSSTSAAPSNGRAKFSESQVSKMSTAEYEKNEAAILDAIKRGEFTYDISGAAR